ncbi:hypothetical protein OG21DRAFT_840750 [Imleria badia]|nr:hypothetical protein OG21DRAFT_840750 [Imleria badia]
MVRSRTTRELCSFSIANTIRDPSYTRAMYNNKLADAGSTSLPVKTRAPRARCAASAPSTLRAFKSPAGTFREPLIWFGIVDDELYTGGIVAFLEVAMGLVVIVGDSVDQN